MTGLQYAVRAALHAGSSRPCAAGYCLLVTATPCHMVSSTGAPNIPAKRHHPASICILTDEQMCQPITHSLPIAGGLLTPSSGSPSRYTHATLKSNSTHQHSQYMPSSWQHYAVNIRACQPPEFWTGCKTPDTARTARGVQEYLPGSYKLHTNQSTGVTQATT